MEIRTANQLADPVISCPVCDSSETQSLWADTIHLSGNISYAYHFQKCLRCGLHFMNPLPSQQIIRTFYQDLEKAMYGPYLFHSNSVGEKYPRFKVLVAQNRFPERGSTIKRVVGQGMAMAVELLIGRRVSFSLSVPLQYPFDASMLDVGCGAGDWLIYMKHAGYQNVMGHDIAGPSVNRLENHGIPVAVGDLCQLQLPSASFDLIRMEHVLEHLPDPVAYICEVRRLLKPAGGRLVINIPNIESLSFRLVGQQWAALNPIYHLHHFSHQSLKTLAEKTGLQLRRYRHLPVYDVMIASLSFKLGAVAHRLLRARPVRVVLEPLYGIAMRLLGTGDYLTAEFVKPANDVQELACNRAALEVDS